jgi:hypothetical protein
MAVFQRPAHLAIEIPVIYPGRNGKGDPNDIVNLARAAQQVIDLGSDVGTWLSVTEYKPRQWKGQVPKPIHHHRAWKALSGAEREVLPADTLARILIGVDGGPYSWDGHNFLDAIALGLKHLKRVR